MIESEGGTDRSRYRWYMLVLSGATATLAVAIPTMAMPVLFSEIAEDLRLSLVQVGAIWGISSFAGVFASMAGGILGDRFGTKRTLSIACIVLGVTGASRGGSNDLAMMTLTVFLSGLVTAAIPINLHKVCAVWFPGRKLGSANAVISGGMALGFMIGSLLSATVLSPWLGGWRHVLFFYGGIAVLMSIPWALTRAAPGERERSARSTEELSIRRTLFHVMRLRDVWILGVALFGVLGGIQGLLGYLPLYLRGIEWPVAHADASLAGFHAISLLTVFPLALLSDRAESRRKLLVIATLVVAGGMGLLSIVDGAAIWIAILLTGALRDGYMAVFITAVTELEGVGMEYAGTALGLAMTLGRSGGLIAPPLGNSLAGCSPRMPFALWAAMALLGLAVLGLTQRDKRRPQPRSLESTRRLPQ